jgi:hypothetical protein
MQRRCLQTAIITIIIIIIITIITTITTITTTTTTWHKHTDLTSRKACPGFLTKGSLPAGFCRVGRGW